MDLRRFERRERLHREYGLTIAEYLGIFVKYGAYFRTEWGPVGTFSQPGLKMYRNYDGLRHTFGDTTCTSTMSDAANTSIYSAIEGQNLHIIILNKNQTAACNATVAVTAPVAYTTGEAWQYTSTNATITKLATNPRVGNGSFTYSLPMQSVQYSSTGSRSASSREMSRPSAMAGPG